MHWKMSSAKCWWFCLGLNAFLNMFPKVFVKCDLSVLECVHFELYRVYPLAKQNWVCGIPLHLSARIAWWRLQMETFSASLAICAGNSPASLAISAGNSPVPGEFPSQRPETRSFDFSLICAWINGWVNNRKAGDLRRNRAHYDVSVMDLPFLYSAVLLWCG